MENNKPKIRISLSVEGFLQRAMDTWNLEKWLGWEDKNQYVLFFGLYTKHDYDAFLRHKGKKIVFWCGSDILNLLSNYENRRILKLFPETEHYCENEVEAEELRRVGIEPKIVPSFLDNINNYPVSYKHSKTPHIFLCGHDKREDEYGLGVVKAIASRVPDTTFHIYGIDRNLSYLSLSERNISQKVVSVDIDNPNIWIHGKVPEGQFNNEIMNYQCGLRTNLRDGVSEVMVKSLLLGQYPITKIFYDKIWSYNTEDELVALIEKLKYTTSPNLEARSWWIKRLNQFPWCARNFYEPNKT